MSKELIKFWEKVRNKRKNRGIIKGGDDFFSQCERRSERRRKEAERLFHSL